MKILLIKGLALCCVFMFVGCEKNRDRDDPMAQGHTTTPHSMQSEPVNPNNDMHDDMQHTSAPIIIEENSSSGVQTGNVTKNSGQARESQP